MLFNGQAKCASCHVPPIFTEPGYNLHTGEEIGIDGAMLDRLAHIALPLGTSLLMGSDVTRPQDFKVGTNHYIALEADTGEEAERVFTRLSDGGSTEMPLQKVEWAEQFGICRDRYGVQWMVSYTGAVTFGQ